jgi:putative acetyltransferase
MRLRSATNADGPAVRELVFGVLHEFGLTPDHGGTDLDLSDIEQHYLQRGGLFEVLEDDRGRIVGTVGLKHLHDGAIELRKMYLHREMRGQGHGRRLLRRALEAARGMGARRIELETSTRLTTAIAMYERAGFRPIPLPGGCPSRCELAYALDLAEAAAASSAAPAPGASAAPGGACYCVGAPNPDCPPTT